MEVRGQELKGYSYVDGIHWHWGDTEIAVIDQVTSEIEWCVRKCTLPNEVVQTVHGLKPKAAGQWIIEARRVNHSTTQGEVRIVINGETLITFGDDKVLTKDGWKSKIPDEDLGCLVCSAFWHPLDGMYHYSDKAKKMFYPKADTDKG